jgi:hypothetical protein
LLYLSKNPFRVIGISSNSGQKIIQKNLSKLKAFSKIGKSKEFDYLEKTSYLQTKYEAL